MENIACSPCACWCCLLIAYASHASSAPLEDGQHAEAENCFDCDGAPDPSLQEERSGSHMDLRLSMDSRDIQLRKYQSISFGGSEPLDEVTKLEDVEGMANGKSHALNFAACCIAVPVSTFYILLSFLETACVDTFNIIPPCIA